MPPRRPARSQIERTSAGSTDQISPATSSYPGYRYKTRNESWPVARLSPERIATRSGPLSSEPPAGSLNDARDLESPQSPTDQS